MELRLKKWILFNFVGHRRMNITIFLFTNILKFYMVTAHPSMPLFRNFSNFQYMFAQNTLFNLRKPQKIIHGQITDENWFGCLWLQFIHFWPDRNFFSRNGKLDSPPIIYNEKSKKFSMRTWSKCRMVHFILTHRVTLHPNLPQN